MVQRSCLRERVGVYIQFTLRYHELFFLMNKDITRDIVKLNACTRDFAGDIFTHESTTCSMGEGNSVRRVEGTRGKHGTGRQTGKTSVIKRIHCTCGYYIHARICIKFYIDPPSSARQCRAVLASICRTPKVTWVKKGTWGSLSCNCLSFCTQNLLKRTATRVYIIIPLSTTSVSLLNSCFECQRVSQTLFTRVRISAGGGCPVQSRLQSTGTQGTCLHSI